MAGEGGGGGSSILKIPVDLSEWDAFIDSYQNYNKLLEKQGDAWANSNKGIREQKTAFGQVESTFSALVEKSINPKFGKTFEQIGKTSKETEKSWLNISKGIERSSKDMQGLLRGGLKFSGMLGFLGLGGAAVGASLGLFGAVAGADNSLASQNILNRKLGLKPDEEAAFNNEYGKAGGDSALLGNVAAAQGDPMQWRYLQAAGISTQDIQGKDAAQLSAELLQKVSEKVNQMGIANAGLWAHAMGIDHLVDTNSMRLAGSYSGQFDGMREQYEKKIPKFAADQQTLDQATAAKQAFDAAWTKDLLEFDKALVKLNPGFIKLAGEVTDMVTVFAGSGELQHDLDELTEGFAEVAKTLKQLGVINDNPDDDAVGAGVDTTKKSAWETGNWLEREFPGFKAWRERQSDWLGPDSNGGVGDGTSDGHAPTNIDSVLDAIRQNESSGRAGAVNPASGAAGLYGLMPDNAKGINVDDPVASRKAARKVLEEQMKAFNGDLAKSLAGYDGDTHVAADERKYKGAWWMGAKQETIDYLKKTENQGIDVGLSPQAQAWIDAHTTDKQTKTVLAHHKAMTKAAEDAMNGDPAIVPYTADDAKAKKDSDAALSDGTYMSEALTDRLMRGMGIIGNGLREGGGAQFASPSTATSKTSSTQQAPFNINVTVNAPPGSNAAVTAGGLAQ